MLIVVDGTSPVVGAGITWIEQMIPALCALASGDRIHLIVRADMTAWNPPEAPNCVLQSVRFPSRGRVLWRLLWQQALLPRLLKRLGADVLISPNDVAPMTAPCPVVLGIQNASPYLGPRSMNLKARVRLRALKLVTGVSTTHATKVFFVSDWSRLEISRVLGLSSSKTAVVRNGVSPQFRGSSGQQRRPASCYVLSVGSIGPHKDYLTLVEGWARLQSGMKEPRVLRVIGPVLESVYLDQVLERIATLGMVESVLLMAPVPLAELVPLYQGADAFVMASQIETFGIPMIEAMACGVPVVSSDIPVAREVCSDAALFYRVGDAESLAERLAAILTDDALREDLVRRGSARAQELSWERAANDLLDLARTAVSSGPGERH